MSEETKKDDVTAAEAEKEASTIEEGEEAVAAEPEQVEPEPTVEGLQEELARTKAEVMEIRLRTQADFENLKKRLTKEHDDHLKYAAEQVMKDIIPTLDNLELAITYASDAEVCQNMLQGVVMTQKLLLDAVARHGLLVVGKVGEPFDPAKHEAMGIEANAELEADAVARVMQSGYSLQGRLVRPAKVMVNKL